MNKHNKTNNELDQVQKNNQSTSRSNFHAPSHKTVEAAADYVEDRFGRALVRLSDR